MSRNPKKRPGRFGRYRWLPTGKHDECPYPTKKHLPERDLFEHPKFQLAGIRGGSSSWSFETGRWFSGCPEQFTLFIENLGEFPYLGFAVSNREPLGAAPGGAERPHKFLQSARAWYYDLNNLSQLAALSRHLRYMAAASAAIEANSLPFRKAFDRFRQDPERVICATPIDGLFRTVENETIENGQVYEELTIRRKENPAGYKPEYQFVLKRKIYRAGEEYPEAAQLILNQAKQFTIPASVISGLLEKLRSMISFARQAESIRIAKTALESFSKSVDWLTCTDEKALWEHPELENEAPRLTQGQRQPNSILDFTSEYIRRLEAYSRGHLKWNPHWKTTETQAKRDIYYLEYISCKFVYYLVSLKALTSLWKGRQNPFSAVLILLYNRRPFHNTVQRPALTIQRTRAPP